jgi:FkbM family methyltransferase
MIGRLLLRGVWLLSWPVRTYWVHSERKLGKRLLLDHIVKPLLPPPPHGFAATVPGGGVVRLYYREEVGLSTLLGGGFERSELEQSSQLARRGTTAIDVGANVGLHTVVLACAVGPSGKVLAFEPEPSNVRRLTENVDSNHFTNVEIHPVAIADLAGQSALHLASDGLYHSTGALYEGRVVGRDIRVPTRTLDEVWKGAGCPTVSFVKIDTEGTELSVLQGAERLLAAQNPPLLVENRDGRIGPWLAARGYVGSRPRGFAQGNMLFCRADLESGIGE